MNKCVLITGAAKRIGAAIAVKLHDANFNITLHYHHSHNDAAALAQQLNNKRAHSAISVQADLLDDGDRQKLVDSHIKHWGELDALINNASRFYPTPVENATHSQWQDLMGSNIEAPFFLSQKCIPYLKKSKGSIINIADIYSQSPLRGYAIYSISKAAIAMLTKTLATELAPIIRVNGVAPGNILWPEDNIPDEITQQRMLDRIPLQRQGTPQNIGDAVLFLMNQPYMTGQTINVDGGSAINAR